MLNFSGEGGRLHQQGVGCCATDVKDIMYHRNILLSYLGCGTTWSSNGWRGQGKQWEGEKMVLTIRYNTINITHPISFPKTTVPWLVGIHKNHTWHVDVHATAQFQPSPSWHLVKEVRSIFCYALFSLFVLVVGLTCRVEPGWLSHPLPIDRGVWDIFFEPAQRNIVKYKRAIGRALFMIAQK